MQAGGHRFDPDTLHFLVLNANRRDAQGGFDPVASADLDRFDELAEDVLTFGWLGVGEAVGDELAKCLDCGGVELGGFGGGELVGEVVAPGFELGGLVFEGAQAGAAGVFGEGAAFEGGEVALAGVGEFAEFAFECL